MGMRKNRNMKQIPLSQGLYALVDATDFDWLSQWKWYAHRSEGIYYAVRKFKGADGFLHDMCMHRQILGLERGDKQQGDHRNHNTLDNRRGNLRICTQSQNNMNRRSATTSSSQFKGVTWDKRVRKWRAQISIKGKNKYLGDFKGEKNAALAYDARAFREFGEFACLNFPTFQRSLVC